MMGLDRVFIVTAISLLCVKCTYCGTTINRIASYYIGGTDVAEGVRSDPMQFEGIQYDYNPNSPYGPQTWATRFSKFCNNSFKYQSPIDVRANKGYNNKGYNSEPEEDNDGDGENYIEIENRLRYDDVGNMNGMVLNNGHTAQFVVADTSDKFLRGVPGNPDDKYKLEEFHFHIGKTLYNGSEHALKGMYFPSEIHLVHYNDDEYGDIMEALTQEDGIAVIGVFVTIYEENCGYFDPLCNEEKLWLKFLDQAWERGCYLNEAAPGCMVTSANIFTNLRKFSRRHNGLSRFILEYVSQVLNPSGVPARVKLSDIIPSKFHYYTYLGSKTTPSCEPNIQWIVLKDTVQMSKTAAWLLRLLKGSDGVRYSVFGNQRPLQPLNGRTVETNF